MQRYRHIYGNRKMIKKETIIQPNFMLHLNTFSMNKKLFLGLLAATGMLLTTACSEDEMFSGGNGNGATISFNLGVESEVNTRAISDGTSADKLVYAVYNEDGEALAIFDGNAQKTETGLSDLTTGHKVNITLAKGQTYTVAFWAQDADCAAYDTDDLKNVTVSYTNAANNDETRDAFFAAETFTVTGNAAYSIELKRPFAQLNVGVTAADYEAAKATGLEITQSTVTIENAATSINLLDGSVAGSEAITFEYAAIPDATKEELLVNIDGDNDLENFEYISTCYFLTDETTTGAEKTTAKAVFKFANAAESETIELSEGLQNIPVQRNYRTNIVGQLLTGNIDFTIEVDPIYDGEYNNGAAFPVQINGKYYETVQEAVTAATAGDVIEIAAGNYNEVISVTGGKNITIQAANATATRAAGEVVLAGINAQQNGEHASTITFKGITINNTLAQKNNEGKWWFTGTGNCAPCIGAWGGNFTFENCTFIVDGSTGKETGVMTWWTTDAITLVFTNCEFKNGTGVPAQARAMQLYGNVNATVTGCTFNVSKDYVLKFVGNEGNVATFDNNVVNNVGGTVDNFIELGSEPYKGSKYKAVIKNTTLGEGIDYFVIAHEEEQEVEVHIADGVIMDATKNYLISNANGMTWFANQVNAASAYNTFKDKTLTLTADIDLENKPWTPIGQTAKGQFSGTFDGGNHTISNLSIDCSSETGDFHATGLFGWLNTATVKNVNIDGADVKGNQYVGAVAGYAEAINTCTIENCHVTNATVEAIKDKAGAVIGYAGNDGTTVKDCTAKDSKILAGRDAGQIAGASKTSIVTGCSATNVSVSHNGNETGDNIRNEVIGREL